MFKWLGGLSALGIVYYFYKTSRPAEAASNVPLTPVNIAVGSLQRLEQLILAMVRKIPLGPRDIQEAQQLAVAFNLPKTAEAISHDSALPMTEFWPGTPIPVKTYIEGKYVAAAAGQVVAPAKGAVQAGQAVIQQAIAAGKDIKNLFAKYL